LRLGIARLDIGRRGVGRRGVGRFSVDALAVGALVAGGALAIAIGLVPVASAQNTSGQAAPTRVESGRTGTAGHASDPQRGAAVFDHWCAPCHAPGPGHPGTQSLEIKYSGSLPAVLEEREDLTPPVVKTFVRQGILSMAPFRKTEITDAELEDLAAYLSK
jgi:mono/diheme cytochrome c family protein